MDLLFTQKCLLLDNLDKNVTASLHVLQIHGVKPLKQLMESSHIKSCSRRGVLPPWGHSPVVGGHPRNSAWPPWAADQLPTAPAFFKKEKT